MYKVHDKYEIDHEMKYEIWNAMKWNQAKVSNKYIIYTSCNGDNFFGGINNLKQTAVNNDILPIVINQIPKVSFFPPNDEFVVIIILLAPSNASTVK